VTATERTGGQRAATAPGAAGWELYSDEHRALRARVRRWVTDRLAPNVDDWEADEDFPRDVFVDGGREGLFGCKVPPEDGGTGPDFVADAVVTEELAACGSGGVAAALGAHKDLGSYYIARFGTADQRRRWVPAALRGRCVTALAVTEPGAGSDVAGVRTRARRGSGGDWILDGAKTFITNGTWADVVVVLALTDPDAGGHHGQTLLVVEAGDAGFAAQRIRTLGWRTSHTGALSFNAVRLPADRVLGGDAMVGAGFTCVMRNFQWERIVMALAAARAAERVVDDAVAAARVAGGPGWPYRLAEAALEVSAARRLAEHALRLHVAGADAVREVSMAKSHACRVAVGACETAIDVLGPAAFASARWERALRDARLGPIGGGTTEILHEVIGRSYGL
jgi:acyl-CoA dehydrogenase